MATISNGMKIQKDRSKFLDEEQIGTKNALEFVGKGRVVPQIVKMPDYGERFLSAYFMKEHGVVPKEYHSSLYQWLPANVVFREDGTTQFTSYINNLHPEKYAAIYETIEHAIDTALPAWEQCLRENVTYGQDIVAGRSKSRFELITRARCVSLLFELQKKACRTDGDLISDEQEELWTKSMTFGIRDEEEEEEEEEDEDEDEEGEEEGEEEETGYVRVHPFESRRMAFRSIHTSVGPRLIPGQWHKTREAILPEPKKFEEIDYPPKKRLREMFKERGLQVIVKMASIELTPEKPNFPTGSWHVSCLCHFPR